MHVSDSFGLGNVMRGADRRSDGTFSYVRLSNAFRQIIRCVRSATWLTQL